jgi:ABC-type cobalamin transport system ATPase subunit
MKQSDYNNQIVEIQEALDKFQGAHDTIMRLSGENWQNARWAADVLKEQLRCSHLALEKLRRVNVRKMKDD